MVNPVSNGFVRHLLVAAPTFGRRADVLFGGVGLVALALAGLINLVTHVPPLQDFNEWVYQGYLIKCLVFGESVSANLKSWPVPNVMIQFLLAGLTSVFSPILAGRVFATLYLIIGGTVMWLASQRSDKSLDGLAFLLLICLAVLHAPYWSGEMNYQVGLLVLVLYFSIQLRHPTESIWLDIVFSLLLFTCHAMCLAIFLVYVGWRSLIHGRIVRGVISVLPVLALVAWYALVDTRKDFDPEPVPQFKDVIDYVSYRFYVLAKVGPYQNLVFDNTSDFHRFKAIYWIGGAINVLVGACIGLFFLAWVIRSVRSRTISPELLTGVVCGVIALVNPAGLLGVANVGERFLYPALILALLCFDGAVVLRRLAGCLSAFMIVILLYILVIVPKGAMVGNVPSSGAIDEARYQLLFWHRPFMYLPQAEAAQSAAVSGKAPTARLVFESSALLRGPE